MRIKPVIINKKERIVFLFFISQSPEIHPHEFHVSYSEEGYGICNQKEDIAPDSSQHVRESGIPS